MIDILFFVFIGIVAGVAAGLIPGIHPNLLALLAGSVLMSMNFFPSILCFISFMVSMGITNSITSFIPSILLGAPDPESSLSVLPGHRLLMKGYGYHAIKLTVIGGLGAVIICLSILPVVILTIPTIYNLIRPNLHIILSVVMIYLTILERKRITAFVCFLLAGFIGIYGSRLPINQNFYLFPVLSGLFGLPMLLLTIKNKTNIPRQEKKEMFTSVKTVNRSVLIGSLAGLITGLLPGIGSAQATVLASVGQKKDEQGFLISVGAITTANILFSFLAIWLIGNPRSGIAVVIQQFAEISFNEFLFMLFISLISCGVAVILTLKISRLLIDFIQKVNYILISKSVFLLICVLVFIFTGFYGLFLTFITTCLGIFVNLVGVNRYQLMGVLLLPTILFFANAI